MATSIVGWAFMPTFSMYAPHHHARRFKPRTTKTKVYTAKLGVSAVDA